MPTQSVWLKVALAAIIACPAGRAAQNGRAANGAARISSQAAGAKLSVRIVSPTGVPVPSAELILRGAQIRRSITAETDPSGRFTFRNLLPGVYTLRVEKNGYYVGSVPAIHVGETDEVELALQKQKEITESVKVTYYPPPIDFTQTSSSSGLNAREILNLPYAVPRDIRYALPLIPGVVQDASGQVHIDGASASQARDELDGFDVTDPVNREFNVRLAPEALDSVEVQDSRYPVRYGRGSGGILALDSGMGGNHMKVMGVNFLPSIQQRDGLHVNGWTPRMVFSGPVKHGKAWYMDGFDGEYRLDLVTELPRGANENKLVRFSNLAKSQVNLSPSNILTASFLVNHFDSPHNGLSPFTPLPSTVNTRRSDYVWMLKDQIYLPDQVLLESGAAVTRWRTDGLPLGDEPYVVQPGFVSGNYFESALGSASRAEVFSNIYLPEMNWLGRHTFEFGSDDERAGYRQAYLRRPFSIDDSEGALLRRVDFQGNAAFAVTDLAASAYAQDRWWISPRLLLQPGVRLDWDTIVRDAVVSPRVAASFMPSGRTATKLVAGIGLYSDATNLTLYSRPLGGERADYFYDGEGILAPGPPAITFFRLQPELREPRVWNWSAGVEQRLPRAIYLRAEFIEKRERDGWAYFNLPLQSAAQTGGGYELRDHRHNQYDAVKLILRRRFRGGHVIFFSYVHSAARSNAALNFTLENPIFAMQAGGPVPWDAPNRFVSWGLVPLWKGFDLAYTADERTGFPFSVFNQNQQLVGRPYERRFPSYLSVDAALERRIPLLGFEWELRAGANDVTGRHNPYVVDNNIDSPRFLTYSSIQGRTLQAQLRFLGRRRR